MIATLGAVLGSGSAAGVVAWLILAVPLLIVAAFASSWHDGRRDARRLLIWALVYVIWLFAPLHFADSQMRQLSAALSIFGWVWLAYAWLGHVWLRGFGPIWANMIVAVALLLLTIGIGLAAALRVWS
jgi:hypothetical protein